MHDLLEKYQRALERIASFNVDDPLWSDDDYQNLLSMMAIAEDAINDAFLDYSAE